MAERDCAQGSFPISSRASRSPPLSGRCGRRRRIASREAAALRRGALLQRSRDRARSAAPSLFSATSHSTTSWRPETPLTSGGGNPNRDAVGIVEEHEVVHPVEVSARGKPQASFRRVDPGRGPIDRKIGPGSSPFSMSQTETFIESQLPPTSRLPSPEMTAQE